jgi:uncharacterized membrane protein
MACHASERHDDEAVDLRRTASWGGLLLGAGLFRLFDGIVDHKVLRVHQVRSAASDLLPYDLAWNAAGVVLVLAVQH